MYSNVSWKYSHDHDYIQTHCHDCRNPFHFAYRKCYSDNNSTMMIEYTYTYSNTVFRKYFHGTAFFKSFCRTIFFTT